jgi:hypothetical protein
MKENFYLSLDNIKSPENMVFSGLKKFSSVKNIFSEFYFKINFILLAARKSEFAARSDPPAAGCTYLMYLRSK